MPPDGKFTFVFSAALSLTSINPSEKAFFRHQLCVGGKEAKCFLQLHTMTFAFALAVLPHHSHRTPTQYETPSHLLA